MRQWFAGIVVVLGGILATNLISDSQDVNLSQRHHSSESVFSEAVAPSFTTLLGQSLNGTQQLQSPQWGSSALIRELRVPAGLRLMVFSPHPDDETLAAGGIIQRVLRAEGTVRVVFMTNGDGYIEAVRARARAGKASSRDFIEYGKLRHEEAVQALCELGLTSEDGLFLGFPDDGIDDLWASNWSSLSPYTSPHTLSSRPPYPESFSKLAKYAGVDLEETIARALKEFAPDWVVIPDPRDEHPDHACTGVFVLDALRKLNQSGELLFDNTKVLTYLVHYRGYPRSEKWVRRIKAAGIAGSHASVRLLSGTQWVGLPLSAQELTRKQRALAAHQSQFEILGGFFKIYLRPTEVFGRLEPAQILAVPQEYSARFNRPSI